MAMEEYIQSFPYTQRMDYSEQVEFLTAKFGEAQTRVWTDVLNGEDSSNEYAEYYQNSPDFVLACDLTMYMETLQNEMKFIEDHRECFGKTILDIGCGDGYLTCFIAFLFPESTVIGLDKAPGSERIGQCIADQLGLTNVTFVNKSFAAYTKKNRKFDTVFSSRTLNYQANLTVGFLSGIKHNISVFAKAYQDYAERIAKVLKKGGFFLHVDLLNPDTEDIIGWETALNKHKINPATPQAFEWIESTELDMKRDFVYFVFQKTGTQTPSDALIRQWFWTEMRVLENKMKNGFYSYLYPKLITSLNFRQTEGVLAEDRETQEAWMLFYGFFSMDETEYFFCYHPNGFDTLFDLYPASELTQTNLDNFQDAIQKLRDFAGKRGVVLQPFDFVKAWSLMIPMD